jgi:D-alanyl-D-alanine carboxypeptidase
MHVPGLTYAVVRDGKIVRQGATGFASLELKAPARAETVYEIGSITKQFTATLIMMLVEQGKLALADPISRYVDDTPDTWKDISLRHLLTHTSGIKGYTEVMPFVALARNDYTPDQIINSVRKLPLNFQPGEKWEYCNTGYYLLGMVIEKVTGKSYWEVLDERILKPLGMSSTRNSNPRDLIPNRARGYMWVKDKWLNVDPITPSAGFAAGSIVSTVGDMAKWDAALYTEKLLKKSSLQQMWTETKLNDGKPVQYGFGWGVDKANGHRVIGHGGGTAAFSTYIARYVDDKLTVIVLTNAASVNAGGISTGIAELNIPALKPKPIVDNDPKTTLRLRKLIEAIIEGAASRDEFTEEAAKELFPQRMKDAAAFLRELGKLKAMSLLEARDEAGGARSFRYSVEFESATLTYHVTLTKEGKISGIRFSG